MNVTRIAVRNITRQKKRSILLGGAIAFGVMIITLIGSFSRGIAETASATFTDILGGQIYITGEELTGSGAIVSVVSDGEIIDEALDHIDDSIVERTYRSRSMAEVIFGSKSSLTSIEGVDWADEPDLVESISIVSGDIAQAMEPNALVLPKYTADDVGVEVGETVLVRTSTVTGQQNVGEFYIAAISSADSMFSFASTYASRSYLNTIIGLDSEDYQVLNVALEHPNLAGPATDQLLDYLRSIGRSEPEEEEQAGIDGMMSRMENMASLMGGAAFFSGRVDEADRWEGTRFNVLNINDMMAQVTAMVNVLNTVSYVIFVVLMLITMIGLLNTFRMVLIERTQEIGTMRAIGMQRHEVRNIFLSEALVLALAGAVSGLLVAFGLSGILSVIPISTESPLQFFLSNGTFTFPVVPAGIISTLVIISVVTLASAYLPARKAAKLDPAVALRTTY